MTAASRFRGRFLVLFAPLCLAALMSPPTVAADPPKATPKIDYGRDIRPILADNCYACHGPDAQQRKRKLRFDQRDSAVAELGDGLHAVVPGKSADSALIDRVTEEDPDRHMPPAKTGKTLTPQQIDLLRAWIDQGAPYAVHWAFVAPVKSEPPNVADDAPPSWVRNPIDQFILARLEKEGLHPSPEADKTTLIRRVTLDLTGLPPTPAEVDAFLADKSPDAYEKLVDRLLASPRYGEHMGRYWLDVARYGDTHGLHLDNYREIWPYRDWVINAFNRQQAVSTSSSSSNWPATCCPTARSTSKLPPASSAATSPPARAAPSRKRSTSATSSSRVDGFGTVFLGLTTGCCRCHDHKFDPIKQKEYYQFFAFFNNLDGPALDGNAALPPPVVKAPTRGAGGRAGEAESEDRRHPEEDRRRGGQGRRTTRRPTPGRMNRRRPRPTTSGSTTTCRRAPSLRRPATAGSSWQGPDHPVFSGKKSHTQKATGLAQHFFTAASPGLRCGEGDKLFAYVYLDPADPPKEIMLQWNTGDWKHRAYWGDNLIDFGKDKTTERVHLGPLPKAGEWVRLEVDAAQVGITPDLVLNGWAFTQFGGTVYWDKAGVVTRTPQGDRPVLRHAVGVAADGEGGRRRRAAEGDPGTRSIGCRRSAPTVRRSSCATTSSATPAPKRATSSRRCCGRSPASRRT